MSFADLDSPVCFFRLACELPGSIVIRADVEPYVWFRISDVVLTQAREKKSSSPL